MDSFDGLSAHRVNQPGQLKALMVATHPDNPLMVIYTPSSGEKLQHFDAVCKIVKVCGNCVLAVDEIDSFMSANDPGPESFYELTNYGRHLRVALAGTTRNTVAVSRQFTSMLTELCIFATTEPRYLKYLEDTCGGSLSERVPLLGKHEYLRWISGGTCECRKGW